MLLRFMLGQTGLTKWRKSKGGATWSATSCRFAWIVIPAHQVGAYQGTYDGSVLCRKRAAGPFAQVGQERHLFSRQIHGVT